MSMDKILTKFLASGDTWAEMAEARDKAKAELLALALSVVPKQSKISSKYSTSLVDRMTYDQGFNDCIDEVSKRLKELMG